MEKEKPKPLSEEFITGALEDVQQMVQATRDVMDVVGLPPEDEPRVFDIMFKGRSSNKVPGQTAENNAGNQEPAPKQPNL
jgi:hypothetical protein